MSKEKRDWKETKKLLSEISGIPEEVIEKRKDFEIIHMAIVGFGSKTTAKTTNVPEFIVTNLMKRYLGLDRNSNLEYNPLKNFRDEKELSDEDLEIIGKYLEYIQELDSYE